MRFHSRILPQSTSSSHGLIHKNPSAISWGTDRIDVFAVGNPGPSGARELIHYWCTNSHSWADRAWAGPESRGGRLRDTSPCAITWPAMHFGRILSIPQRMDIFAIGSDDLDGMILQWTWNGRWIDAAPIPGQARGFLANCAPCAIAVNWNGQSQVHLFAVDNPEGLGGPRTLQHWWSINDHWFGPQRLGGRLWDVGPAVASRGNNQLDVLATADNGQLLHFHWDGANWSITPRGGNLANGAGPSVAWWGGARLDVFAIGSNQSLQHWWVNGDQWNGPESLGSVLEISTPCAVSSASGVVDVFATTLVDYVGGPRHLAWWHYDNVGWAHTLRVLDWVAIGGPAAIARFNNLVDVFAVHDANAFSGPADQMLWAFSDDSFASFLRRTTLFLPEKVLRTPYHAQIQTESSDPPVSFLRTDGALPLGIVLNDDGSLGDALTWVGGDTLPGVYTFTVRMSDSATPPDVVLETFELSVAGDPLPPPPPPPSVLPDLCFGSPVAIDPAWPIPGESIDISYVVTNCGGGGATQSHTDTISITQDADFGSEPLLIPPFIEMIDTNFPPYSQSETIASGLPAGRYTLTVRINSDMGESREVNLANNEATINFEVSVH